MNTIALITQTSVGSARFAANWLASCQALGIDDRARVYCTDDEANEKLGHFLAVADNAAEVSRRYATGAPEAKAIPRHEWGTVEYIRFNLWKLDLLLARSSMLQANFRPHLYCDTDTVLLQDPELNLRAFAGLWPGQPVFMQSDRNDFDRPQTKDNNFNPGVIFVARPAADFWQCAYRWLLERIGEATGIDGRAWCDDQMAVNRTIEYFEQNPECLTPQLWRNGAQHWGQTAGEVPILVHANWDPDGAKKEARLRANGWWFVQDSALAEVGL